MINTCQLDSQNINKLVTINYITIYNCCKLWDFETIVKLYNINLVTAHNLQTTKNKNLHKINENYIIFD